MKIKLMSKKEYEKYKNVIPKCNIYWWLRSPGIDDENAVNVDGLGGVYAIGSRVNFANVGVRPIIKCNDNEIVVHQNLSGEYIQEPSQEIPVGWVIVINSCSFTCIDKNLYIATVPIDFDKFDDDTNIYKNSYIKKKIKKMA